MKLFTRLLFVGILLSILTVNSAYSQCTQGTLYGTGTASSTCTTVTTSLGCHYIAEYAKFTGLTIGNTYEIGTNVTGTPSATTVTSGAHIMTLFDGTGTAIDFLSNPTNNLINITFVATSTEVRAQMNTYTGNVCGTTGSYCHYYGLRCLSCSGPGAPTCPTLSSPVSNATGVSTLPTLTWASATNAVSYDVYLDADPGCSGTPGTLIATVTTTSYTLTSSLLPSTKYRWMVVPKDCAGAMPASCLANAFCFTTSVPPPANDNCTGTNGTPVTLTPQPNAASCSSPVSSTTAGATQSNTNCSSTATNDDVWFTFTTGAGITSQIIRFQNVVAVSGTVTSMGMDLYTTCGGTNTNCNTAVTLTSGSGQATLTGLTGNTTYYLRVWTAGTSNSASFDICVIDPPPPPSNDDCAGATPFPTILPDGNCVTLTNQTTAFATNSLVTPTGSCSSNSGTPDDDVWFSFVAPGPTVIMTGTWVSGVTDVYWQVFSSACGSTMTSILCTDTDAGGTLTGLTTGNTYYIRLYTWSSAVITTQNICLKTPPPPPANDECAGAIAVTVNSGTTCTSTTAGTSVNATQSQTSCAGTADDDVWFSFVPTSCSHTITVTPGTMSDVVFQVFSGACGALTSVVCVDNTAGTSAETTTLSNLTIGNTYYMRVHSYSSASGNGTFTVCITTPAPMTFVSSTTTQPNTTAVAAGTANVDVIRLEITVINTGCPLSVSQIQFNNTGTTNLADITNAKVYYTGTSTTFSTTTAFGSAIASPGSGTLTFTGSQVLTGGAANTVNYFWLAYDIASCATQSNVIDGQSVDFTFTGGSANIPSVTDPAGTRSINAGTTYTSVANGAWSAPATWGGCPPPAGATSITINSNVTLDANFSYPGANLTVNATKTLTLNSGSALVIGPSGGGNKTATINGTLTLSSGSLEVNGNVVIASTATFNQSAGDLRVDGNSGATGPASGTALLAINTSTLSLTGGTITIVDPPFVGTGNAFSYNNGTAANAGGSHKFVFGDGASTTAGSGPFNLNTWVGSSRFAFNDVDVNTLSGTNRYVPSSWSYGILGNLNIISGELRGTTTLYIGGDLTNNGTLTTSSTTLAMQKFISGTSSSAPNAQTISGNGVFRNLTASPTANISSLTIDNASTTGVTITSTTALTGVGTGSISGTLTLTKGKLNNASPLTLGTGTGAIGSLSGGSTTSYITGEFRRWNTSGSTGTAGRIFPIGSTTSYQPININFTTAQTTGGVISGLFTSGTPGNSGLPLLDGGITCTLTSATGYWTVERISGTGGTYTADANATGFTKADGTSPITLFSEIRLLKRPTGGSWVNTDGTPVAPAGLSSVTRTGCTGFSQFAIGGTDLALPLELKSFTGKTLEATNMLYWTATNEKNVQWYIIERSANGFDEWNEVGRKTSNGNSTTDQSYTLEDRAPIAKGFYRLRSVDFDGQEQTSNVIALTRKDDHFGIISIFPNPATDLLNVQFSALEEATVTVQVTDLTGRLIMQRQTGVQKGINAISIELSQLNAGTYSVNIVNGTTITEPLRFVKQ